MKVEQMQSSPLVSTNKMIVNLLSGCAGIGSSKAAGTAVAIVRGAEHISH